jgi:hypothetical protein
VAVLIPRALAVITALILSADFGFAQDKPDFSGSWILRSDPSDADVPKALSIQQPLHRTNRLGELVTPSYFDITIARTLPTGTSSQTFWIGTIGGSVTGGVVGDRASGTTPRAVTRTHSRVDWEEQTLVLESFSYTGPAPETGDWSERREMISLTPNGDLRLEMTSRSSTSDRRTSVVTYRRQ